MPDPDGLLPAAGHLARWLDSMVNDGFDAALLTPQGTDHPGSDLPAPADAASGGDGSLQVLEPPATSGLLDSIVGDVVASYLGK